MIFDGWTAAKKIEAELLASGRLAGKSLLILWCAGARRGGALDDRLSLSKPDKDLTLGILDKTESKF